MATATIPDPPQSPGLTLHNVPWATYAQLRDEPGNGRVRMAYLDGTLTLMSPAYRHERGAETLGLLIRGVTQGLGLEVLGAGSTTLRDPGKEAGKEPDTSFYLGDHERRMRTKEEVDLNVDPPPDLAIEVDHSHDSQNALAIYARLGVPEVWRYDVRRASLWFGRLEGDSYREVDRSACLPRLTPALVLQALAVLYEGEMGENAWLEWLRNWARDLPGAPATA
ncbi:Uma2 family endonuclease [Tundrisphaera lichenicola]|uniref:Uma2 family endonuclease n=1 Tax=Tundrisphaera lichenicola TaxID=2029860 RepID=UPI003EBADC3B